MSGSPLTRKEICTFNAVQFKRQTDGAPVYVVPEHIVKLEPMRELFVTRIVTTTGDPEVVEGSPTDVSRRLRSGQ